MVVVIPRNTPVPTRKTSTMTTALDNQSSLSIKVFEGERARSTDNNLLGELVLTGIQIAPRFVPKIEVSFDLHTNGILNVHARDKITFAESSISLRSGRLLRVEIEKMVEEANKFKARGRKTQEQVESKVGF
ncbi:OLC1v1004547C1 [Oldenlandia corymbosa var. corymbosa]|uniref:OLC1v1004547C1 n=1 Tax=Oldenlandia corymbosa var. corymbosa TaxID=529605 RepID=A0AAV1DCK4_OLDCO|nr:OLC1v1004547C1 [Oldenlandia corymbosa var. corymbosa]